MEVREIIISKEAGPVIVTVDARRFPQSVAGNVWRYNADKSFDLKSGIFNTDVRDVPLGTPEELHGKFFYVKGVVISFNDDPPTPYLVTLSVTQGEQTLLSETPKGWSGQLSDKDIGIGYKFQIKVV